MAKKDNRVLATAPAAAPVATMPAEEPVLYESEAYGDPQPDAGATTTIMKPVGIGGPVPIVAPKHNTIQLQPIVVPLALVPYMTQDSDVLRTEGGAAALERQDYAGAVEFDRAEQKAAARTSTRTKIAYFKPDIHPEFSLAQADAIGMVINWAKGDPFDYSLTLVNIVAAAFCAMAFIVTLVSLFAGRYPRKTVTALSLLSAAAYAAEIAHQEIAGHFDPVKDSAVLMMLALTGLAFIVSVIFLAVCVKREDREDLMLRSHGEI